MCEVPNSHAPIELLNEYVEIVDQNLLEASEVLRGFSELKTDLPRLQQSYEKYENLLNEFFTYQSTFEYWSTLELAAVPKSELVRSLGQIKRLMLVTKNLQRMSREALGIPDPERMQDELNMQLQMMGTIRPDQF